MQETSQDSLLHERQAPRVMHNTPVARDPAIDKPFITNSGRLQRNSKAPARLTYVYNVVDDNAGKVLKNRQLLANPQYQGVWSASSANKFGRLAQGIRNIE